VRLTHEKKLRYQDEKKEKDRNASFPLKIDEKAYRNGATPGDSRNDKDTKREEKGGFLCGN